MTNMIYKKYVIEITYDVNVIQDLTKDTSHDYNMDSFVIKFNKIYNVASKTDYMDRNGVISPYNNYFDLYEEAYNTLSKYYYNMTHLPFNKVVKIVECYNDIPIPIKKLRKVKLKQLISNTYKSTY